MARPSGEAIVSSCCETCYGCAALSGCSHGKRVVMHRIVVEVSQDSRCRIQNKRTASCLFVKAEAALFLVKAAFPYSGLSPYLLTPCSPSITQKTIFAMGTINHHPLCPVSCILLTPTARHGSNITRYAMRLMKDVPRSPSVKPPAKHARM